MTILVDTTDNNYSNIQFCTKLTHKSSNFTVYNTTHVSMKNLSPFSLKTNGMIKFVLNQNISSNVVIKAVHNIFIMKIFVISQNICMQCFTFGWLSTHLTAFVYKHYNQLFLQIKTANIEKNKI